MNPGGRVVFPSLYPGSIRSVDLMVTRGSLVPNKLEFSNIELNGVLLPLVSIGISLVASYYNSSDPLLLIVRVMSCVVMNSRWLGVGQDTGKPPYVDLIRPTNLVIRTVGSNGLRIRKHSMQAVYIDLVDAGSLVSDSMGKRRLPCRP